MYGTSSTTFNPIAEPNNIGFGFFVVFTSINHLAFLPSSVNKPKYGAFPKRLHIISIPIEFRLVLAPRTEFTKLIADDSDQQQ